MMREHRLAAGGGEIDLVVTAVSHVGNVRKINEDSLLAEPPVFAVADGMGGHAFGDRASATAVEALREEFDQAWPIPPERVLAGIRRANTAVRELTTWAGDERVIAGTTLTGVALVLEHPAAAPRWMVFNLGDSRVYRWADGRLERISVDHSVVQELFDAGLIDEERTRTHPDRNVITRALGAADLAEAETWLLPADQKQTFLICSDGLTKELDEARIAELLAEASSAGDLGGAADRLLEEALAAGGGDNVTIIIISSRYTDEAGAVAPENDAIDEITRERELSPELDDTRPRI